MFNEVSKDFGISAKRVMQTMSKIDYVPALGAAEHVEQRLVLKTQCIQRFMIPKFVLLIFCLSIQYCANPALLWIRCCTRFPCFFTLKQRVVTVKNFLEYYYIDISPRKVCLYRLHQEQKLVPYRYGHTIVG